MATRKPDDKSLKEMAANRSAAPASPAVAHLYQEPTEEDWRLLEEAEACQRFIEKRISFCVWRVRTHVTSGYTTPFSDSAKLTPKMVEAHKENARNLLAGLRDIRALLRGANSDARFEERTLVQTVADAAPDQDADLERCRWKLSLLAESRAWDAKKPRTFDTTTLDGVVEAIYTVAESEMSPDTLKKLQTNKAREHIKLAASYRGDFQRPPKRPPGKGTQHTPAWLVPLFIAAKDAGLVPGDPDVHGWYVSLLRRKILTPDKTRSKAAAKAKRKTSSKGKSSG